MGAGCGRVGERGGEIGGEGVRRREKGREERVCGRGGEWKVKKRCYFC